VRTGAATVQADEISERYADAVCNVERAEQELVAWTNGELVSVLGEESFTAGYQERQRVLNEARETLSKLPQSDAIDMPLPDFDFDGLSPESRRQLVQMFIDRIEVSRGRGVGRLRIIWRALL
jgi:hypothetical protein